jgi:hypothetical protein
MASAGTLITDLDGAAPVGSDTDIVAQIMADMNSGGNIPAASQQHALPPAPSGRSMMPVAPNPNSVLQNTIDPNVASAHIIGNRQPTPSDFAAMMGNNHGSLPGFPLQGGSGMLFQQQQQQHYMPQMDPAAGASTGIVSSLFPSGNLLKELKTPILVAIIFCLMSLPVVNVMIGHYFPRLLRIGGDLTVGGLGVKSLMAGAVFFIIQRVFVPLVTN